MSGTFSQASERLAQRAVGQHLGDGVVDGLLQAILALVQADMRRRGHQLEFLLRLQRLLARQHLRADVVADDHQLRLAGDEGLDDGVVVVEALDVGRRRRGLGERGVLQRAAIDGDRLAGEVVLAFDLEVVRSDHGDVVGRVGGGEVDDLLALLRVADAHQDVGALLGEVGNAVLAGDADQVELHLQLVGDGLRDVDVVALEAHVGAGRRERREVGEDADIDLAGSGDVVDGVGMRGRCRRRPMQRARCGGDG